jgi:hypothetical protein
MTLPDFCSQGHNMEKQYIENLLSEKMHNRKFKSVQEKICWEVLRPVVTKRLLKEALLFFFV